VPEAITALLPAGGYFVEAGRRAHVVWCLDGSFSGERDRWTEIVNPPGGGSEGVWIEPWRVADNVDFAVLLAEGAEAPLERFATQYRRHDGVSEIVSCLADYPDVVLGKRVWVPLYLPAVVVELVAANRSDEDVSVTLRGASRLRLSLGWPVGASEPPRFAIDEHASLMACNGFGRAGVAVDPPPEAWHLDADRASWQVQLVCPGGGEARARVVIAAGSEDPRPVARKALRRADDLLGQRVKHYRACAATGPRLDTPAADLDRAFALARPALEDFKHHDPAVGLGYFAGYPAYNFYFAGDAFRMLHGACVLGDWYDSREALRTIIRGQRLEDDDNGQLVGELWHELSTTGHQISPNFVTLELPSIVLHYVRWSGDLDFAREAYPAAVLAGEWAARKDRDGDGLPDNGPEQTFADGVREDLNVAGAHLNPAMWQLRAFGALAELARLVGKASDARAWRRRARRTSRTIAATFWDATYGYPVETIRADGQPDSGPGFVSVVEPGDELDQHLRDQSLRAELEEERALQAGRLGSAASFPSEARQARAYYVMDRGDRARRLLQAGWADAATRALCSIARLPFRPPQAGFFPEIASRAEDVADPRGCFHQGWTPAYGLAYPVVAGLWGVRPDALARCVEVAPNPPADWDCMRLSGLRIGDDELDLAWRRLADGMELTAVCRRGPLELVVRLPRPPGAARVRLRLNGRRTRAWRRSASGGAQVVARVSLTRRRPARLALRWGASHGHQTDEIVRHTGLDSRTFAGASSPPAVARRQAGRVAPPEVVYCGFLAPPFSGIDLEHVPLNYATRRPAALLDGLGSAKALVLTDQQDAPLTAELASAIAAYVRNGGALLFFCAWSAAWGRGFFDTYCSVASSSVPDLLPLRFGREPIRSTHQLRLGGPGRRLWADLPWASAPRLDYQPSVVCDGAKVWATAAEGTPLAASWAVGGGRVVAIGLDCFGDGHGTLVHWPGQRSLLRRALDWLRGAPRA
jgi:hypothetical protein